MDNDACQFKQRQQKHVLYNLGCFALNSPGEILNYSLTADAAEYCVTLNKPRVQKILSKICTRYTWKANEAMTPKMGSHPASRLSRPPAIFAFSSMRSWPKLRENVGQVGTLLLPFWDNMQCDLVGHLSHDDVWLLGSFFYFFLKKKFGLTCNKYKKKTNIALPVG